MIRYDAMYQCRNNIDILMYRRITNVKSGWLFSDDVADEHWRPVWLPGRRVDCQSTSREQPGNAVCITSYSLDHSTLTDGERHVIITLSTSVTNESLVIITLSTSIEVA